MKDTDTHMQDTADMLSLMRVLIAKGLLSLDEIEAEKVRCLSMLESAQQRATQAMGAVDLSVPMSEDMERYAHSFLKDIEAYLRDGVVAP